MAYFSRATLDAGNYQANRILKGIARNPYSEHQTLWSLYPEEPDARRDFIYRGERHRFSRVYYLVSKREPLSEDSAWNIETKSYAPRVAKGQRFSFNLRVNPVVTRKDSAKRSHRHDVVMDAKIQYRNKGVAGNDRPPIGFIIQKAGIKWLVSRSEKNGFTFDERGVIVEDYQRYKAIKSKGKPAIDYSTLDFKGTLMVTDLEKFTNVLINGIGPAKAFGCGLMLVRRI